MTVTVSKLEKQALYALHSVYHGGEAWCLYFRNIAQKSGLPLHQVRRVVRALARKGLAEYRRGLMDEDGIPAGAGYCCTDAGAALIASLDNTPAKPTLEQREQSIRDAKKSPCQNCGMPGAHFVPPSLGEAGFFTCIDTRAARGAVY